MATMIAQNSGAFITASKEKTEDLGGGISRQMMGFGPDLMICRVAFENGSVGEVHQHPHSQSTYVESGRFLVEIDGEKQELGAGDGFFVDPHLHHGAVCLEAGVLIDTFSPAREDFLGEGA
ncbi:MAG: cupin domain-containing protein [Erythrobacter sp.]